MFFFWFSCSFIREIFPPFICMQAYQKHMETFDQNVANITTWMYRAEILLDESETQLSQQKEEIIKVTNPIFRKTIQII